MNPASETRVWAWPKLPPRPRLGELVLVRRETGEVRREARRLAREATVRIIAAWSGREPGGISLRETPAGPVWDGPPGEPPLAFSFSYCGGAAWIGLVRGPRIGIDAAAVREFPELEEVSRLYFDPGTHAAVLRAGDRDLAFAQAWTRLEAAAKYERQGLEEWRAPALCGAPGAGCRLMLLETAGFVVSAILPGQGALP